MKPQQTLTNYRKYIKISDFQSFFLNIDWLPNHHMILVGLIYHDIYNTIATKAFNCKIYLEVEVGRKKTK